jgi:hypothetical protein
MPIFHNRLLRGAASRLAGWLAILLSALLMSSCGGGVGEALVVPFITFQFEGVVTDAGGKQEQVRLNLTSADVAQGKTSGAVTATLSVAQQFHNDVSGTYRGESMQLNVPGAAAPLASAYSAQFVEPDTIELTPNSASLPVITLLRADNSFRPLLHDSHWSGKDATGQVWKVHFVTDPAFSQDATEFLKGDESVGGQVGMVSGYAVMRRIELDVVRGTQTVHLSGRMGPLGQTPPANPATPVPAQTISFSDGSALMRD